MTQLSSIDALALPAELARQPRLDPKTWALRELSILPEWGKLPQMEATVQPLDGQAIRQAGELSGQCFLAAGHLWQIRHGSVAIQSGEFVIYIVCQAIWRQDPEQDSRNPLPPLSLP